MVFQHRKINNRSVPSTSRESRGSSSARLLWEFSKYRAICEVSHACCCGVCPSRSLSPSLPPAPSTPPALCSCYPPPPPIFFLSLSSCLPHPPPFSPSPSPYTFQSASVVSADCCTRGERGKRDIASIGVLVRVCGRWRLLWQGESEFWGWWWGAELCVD